MQSFQISSVDSFFIFRITAPNQRHRIFQDWLAIFSTRAWLCFTVWMPVAMLVMQLTANAFMLRYSSRQTLTFDNAL